MKNKFTCAICEKQKVNGKYIPVKRVDGVDAIKTCNACTEQLHKNKLRTFNQFLDKGFTK